MTAAASAAAFLVEPSWPSFLVDEHRRFARAEQLVLLVPGMALRPFLPPQLLVQGLPLLEAIEDRVILAP